MKRKLFAVVVLSVLAWVLMSAQPAPKHESTTTLDGTWLGALTVPGGSMRIVFNIKTDSSGELTATLDSPDQGAKGIPVSRAAIQGERVGLEVSSVNGMFLGTWDGKDEIKGEWKQSGMTFPLTLKRTDRVEEPKRPQTPKPPFPYSSEDVTVKSSDGTTLAGTLTLPPTKEPCPAVLLVTGSGPENRDEEIFGHKPFLVIADYLTRRGIAVLRMDDRGVGKSKGDFKTATEKDFVDDALAGVEYLKGRKEINRGAIGILGHSEGGIIAPRAAIRSKDVAFIILMEGPGVTGERILLTQTALIMKAMGIGQATIDKNLKTNKEIFAVIKAESDDKIAEKKVADLLKKDIPGTGALDAEKRKALEARADVQAKATVTQWFREFIAFDPATALKKVKCPVLATGGSLDLQVPADENLAAIAKALKEAGNKDVTIKKFEGLNHLLQPAKTGLMSEYPKIETTISPNVLKLFGDWILERYHPCKPFGKSTARGSDEK